MGVFQLIARFDILHDFVKRAVVRITVIIVKDFVN